MLVAALALERRGCHLPADPLQLPRRRCSSAPIKEALSLSHDDIGREHILLALVGEKEGAAARVLADLDADPDRIRDLVIAELPGPPRA